MQKKHFSGLILAVLIFILAAGWLGQKTGPKPLVIPDEAGKSPMETEEIEVSVPENPVKAPEAETPAKEYAEDSLEIRFLDVGQGDCALVRCGAEAMLIDGGGRSASDLLYSCLKSQGIDKLKYAAATHPDGDHIGGLPGALQYAEAEMILSPTAEYDSPEFENLLACAERQGTPITVPRAGDRFSLGAAQFEILGPLIPAEDTNNNSIVLRLVYGETSFLFMGDAESEEEETVLNSGAQLESTVLKIGHHGSRYSTGEALLERVKPFFGVISVGEENAYGHPTETVLQRLKERGVTVFRTDLQGDIFCSSDGRKVTFSVEKGENADVFAPPGPAPGKQEETEYVLNTGTGRFHRPSCRHAAEIKDKNRQIFEGTREELLAMGYSPCGSCQP